MRRVLASCRWRLEIVVYYFPFDLKRGRTERVRLVDLVKWVVSLGLE